MEVLEKSIDGLIDELLVEHAEPVEKSMIKDQKPQDETADEAKAKTPGSGTDDDKRGAGRPKQISDVPKTDTDGKRAKDYDGDIAEKNEDAKKKEDSQVTPPKHVKKSVSDEEWEEYQALKKAKQEADAAEALKKAETEKADLIKSAIAEAQKGWEAERAELKKSMDEQAELIKAMANKPQRSKSITNMAALEKSGSVDNKPQLSKSEMRQVALDVGEELVKAGKLNMNSVIEFENTGSILDKNQFRILKQATEQEIKRRG